MPSPRDTSSKAVKIRTSWFPIVVNIDGIGKEVHIGWKYADGSVGMYSSDAKTKNAKMPWGCIVDCEFHSKTVGLLEDKEFLRFQNRSFTRKDFSTLELNPFVWQVNDLTTYFNDMKVNGKLKLLSLYLSLLPKCKGFSNHQVGVHDHFGMRNDLKGVTEKILTLNSGSVDELSHIVSLCEAFSLNVASRREIIPNLPCERKKRVLTDSTNLCNKKGRSVLVDDARRKEIEDKEGLEIKYNSQHIGRLDIPLSNLKVSEKVSLPISQLKVKCLSKSMLECFDQAQIVLTVAPCDGQEYSKENRDHVQYEVIHGRHRLMALKEIEQLGRLDELVGMKRKLITCNIMNVMTSAEANFGAIRGNLIQASYTRKPYLHELVYIYEELLKTLSADKCEEVMMRYGRFLSFGADDLIALKKIGKLPPEGRQVLVDAFHLYESFKTLDAKEAVKRKTSSIMAGKPLQVPNMLFRQLSKVDSDFLVSYFPKVKSKNISVKDIVTQFNLVQARSKVASLVLLELGSKSLEEARVLFPEKLDDKIFDSFLGAIIGKNSTNQKGADLKKYCESLLDDTSIGPLFTYKVVDSVLKLPTSHFADFKCIVFNVKCFNSSWFELIEAAISENDHLALVILLPSEEQQAKACIAFRSTHSKKVLEPHKIYFLKETSNFKGVDLNDNMVYGVLCYQAVYNPPIKVFNGDLFNLENVVNQLSPPDAKNCFVNEGDLCIVKVHSQYSCSYIGQGSAIHKFMIESAPSRKYSHTNDSNLCQTASPEQFHPIATSSFLENSDELHDELLRDSGFESSDSKVEESCSETRFLQFKSLMDTYCVDYASVDIASVEDYVKEVMKTNPFDRDEISRFIKMCQVKNVITDAKVL